MFYPINNNSIDETSLLKNPYYLKYRDYIEYDKTHGYFTYFLPIENFNNNTQWPLLKCPKCNYDLKINKYMKELIHLGYNKDVILLEFILLILLSFCLAFNVLSIFSACIIFIVATLIIFMKFSFRFAYTLKIYQCPNCVTLLYNKRPSSFTSNSYPEEIFSRLEQIPGFKLK